MNKINKPFPRVTHFQDAFRIVFENMFTISSSPIFVFKMSYQTWFWGIFHFSCIEIESEITSHCHCQTKDPHTSDIYHIGRQTRKKKKKPTQILTEILSNR